MKSTWCVTGVLLTAATAIYAQPAAFEVASVKPAAKGSGDLHRDPLGPPINVKVTPGSLTILNVPLKQIVAWAYHIFPYQVSGPGTMDSDRFDIVAKAPQAVDEDGLRVMLQKLLADRFKMTVHHETKEMQAYVVTVSKGGIKFKESTTDGEPELTPPGKGGQLAIDMKRITMQKLAEQIGYNLPIQDAFMDQTGLKGKYDISINLTPILAAGQPQGIDDVINMMVQVMNDQLGLKVDHHKAPVDVIVVDHVERTPIEN